MPNDESEVNLDLPIVNEESLSLHTRYVGAILAVSPPELLTAQWISSVLDEFLGRETAPKMAHHTIKSLVFRGYLHFAGPFDEYACVYRARRPRSIGLDGYGLLHIREADAVIPFKHYKKREMPQWLRHRVISRDGNACMRCRSPNHLRVDHVVPEWRGGGMDIANLQTLCRSCNSRKGSRLEGVAR